MGIFKHPKTGIYHANYFDAFGKRCRPSLGTKDKRLAEIKFADIRRTQTISKEKGIVNISWEDFKTKINTFLSYEKKPGTILHYNLAFRYFENFFRPKFLAQITPFVLEQFKQYLKEKGTGNNGINKYIGCIKYAMRQAENWELIPRQDWTNVSKFKVKKGRLIFYTEEELSKLLQVANNDWKLIIMLGAFAGLRRTEIAHLKWADIDFTNKQLYVEPSKTETFRYVPLTKDLFSTLKKYPHLKQSPYVINIGIENGKNRESKDYISASFYEIIERADIANKGSLHTLRHTFASHLVQNGVSLYTVSKLLGHKSIKTTEIYAHLAPKTLHNAVDKLPQIRTKK